MPNNFLLRRIYYQRVLLTNMAYYFLRSIFQYGDLHFGHSIGIFSDRGYHVW